MFPCRTEAHEVRCDANWKSNAGSSKERNGAPDAKDALACRSDATDSLAGAIRAVMACGAGWHSASLPTISSTLDAGWAPHNPPKSEALLHQRIVQWKTRNLIVQSRSIAPRVRISFLRKHHFAPESS